MTATKVRVSGQSHINNTGRSGQENALFKERRSSQVACGHQHLSQPAVPDVPDDLQASSDFLITRCDLHLM